VHISSSADRSCEIVTAPCGLVGRSDVKVSVTANLKIFSHDQRAATFRIQSFFNFSHVYPMYLSAPLEIVCK